MDGLIYAYHNPRCAEQQAYTQQRVAALAAQRKERAASRSSETTEHHERPGSISSSGRHRHSRTSSINMDTLAFPTFTDALGDTLIYPSDEHPSMTELQERELLDNPFELRHGRRYLREVPYPLPCDLAEIHRQSLRTLLAVTVFGRAVCAPRWETDTPKRVLDFCCGSGYWSAMAHDYFSERGATNVEFTGLDLAPLAPDYRRQGINWKFVQHDLRRLPLPFDDGHFDIVMIKDTSLTNPLGPSAQSVLDDLIRLVKPGGTLEVWDSDYMIRSLPSDQPPPPSPKPIEQTLAAKTGTFAVGPGYPFATARNKFIRKSNAWIAEALDQRRYFATPCAHYAGMLLQEPALCEIEQKRVAVPFGELKWECDSVRHKRVSHGHDSPMSVDSRRKLGVPEMRTLTPDQAALRHTALLTLLQGLESMEVMLKEVSGKSAEDWNIWWTAMMTEMLDPTRASLTGECLELGAWWATKLDNS